MTATAAEALELALWLHRSPARRAALLGRPLPDGIGQLLHVASGARDQVAAAATITGEDEATILEAVRFYLQQILFHEDADAYRVLGLDAAATPAQAREHHRLLQQWLHPDRSGADAWETVYATRINRAWSHLKTPQARAAYDATRAASAVTDSGSSQGVEYQVVARSLPATSIAPPATRSRNLALVVLLGCVGLLVLIALRQEQPPEWREERGPFAGPAAPESGEIPAPLAMLEATFADASQSPPPVAPSAPAAQPSPNAVWGAEVTAKPAVPVKAAPREPAVPPAAFVANERSERPRAVPVAIPAQLAVPTVVRAAQATVAAPVSATLIVPAAGTTPTAPAVRVPDAFDRMTEAQDRTRAVLGYLGDPRAGLPPVWNDVPTMQHADEIRAALHARQGSGNDVPLELRAPRWRLSASGAHLESRYRAGPEQGWIELAFTWRENQLLVSDIALEPDA